MKQITIKTDNKEYIFDVFKNDNSGRSFILQNGKYKFVYSYNTLVYGENIQKGELNFFSNDCTNISVTTRKHVYNTVSPFVSDCWQEKGLKTKNGNSKETLIKFICRCGENMPYFMPLKLNLKNIEYEINRFGGLYVKSIKKGII